MTTSPLANQLLPPAQLVAAIRRQRLLDRLDLARSRRLTTVVAGPGYGKSVLLAEWADRGSVWYTATAADRNPFWFARGLLAALRLRLPGLPASVIGATTLALGPYANPDRETQADAMAEVIAAEVAARMRAHLVLVVDDAHELVDDVPTLRLLEVLCRHAPPMLHLVLASRTELGFPVDRLRTAGDLLELSASDLAFTRAETAELVALVLDPDPGLAARIHALTSGWPAAVSLAAESVASSSPAARSVELARLSRSSTTNLSGLVDEVLASAPSALRELVLAVAPYERFTVGLAQAIGRTDARSALAAAERFGSLVLEDPGDPGWYLVAPLVREHLRRTGPPAPLFSAQAGARWLEDHGRALEALVVYDRYADHPSIVRLLDAVGAELLAAGRADVVAEAAASVPAPQRTDALDLLEGEARQVRGDNDGALVCFRRLIPEVGPVPAAVAWRVGLALHLRGDLPEAFDIYERGLDGNGTERDRALVRGWLAAATFRQGDEVRCRELGADALTLAESGADDHAAAVAHTALAMAAALAGDRRANEMHYLRALEHAERIGDVLQIARVRSNRASRFLEEGAFTEALDELEIGLHSAELAGSSNFRALSLLNRAQAYLGLGRLDESHRDAEAALQEYQRVGSRTASYALMVLGEVHRERGDLTLARSAFEEAVAVSEPNLDLQGLVPALAGLARTLSEQGIAGAADVAAQASAYPAAIHHQIAVLAAGWVALDDAEPERARELAAEAAAVARHRRDRPTLAGALLLAAAADGSSGLDAAAEAREIARQIGSPLIAARADLLLAELGAADGAGLASAAAIEARRLGARRLAAAAELAAHGSPSRHPLVARTLGGFQVVVDGQPLPLGAWGSRKPRDLFKILLTRRGRPVPRDVVVELLWPGEDPARGQSRLSVALSTLRAALDPGHVHDPDHAVGADRASLWVRTEHVHVDLEEFLGAAARGLASYQQGELEAARLSLRTAEATYAGDFLEDDPYDEWAGGVRAEARNTYITVAHALAAIARTDGDFDAAASLLFRVLARDPHDERAHLGLVSALEHSGRRGDARRAYRSYAGRMAEIEVEPQPFPAG